VSAPELNKASGAAKTLYLAFRLKAIMYILQKLDKRNFLFT